MNRLKRYFLVVALVLLAVCILPFASAKAATKAQITLEGPTEVVRGETFEVKVYMQLTDFTADAYGFDILYDSDVLTVNDDGVVQVYSNEKSGIDFGVPTVDPYIQIFYGASVSDDSTMLSSGSKIHLVTVSFTAKVDAVLGDTSISVDKYSVSISNSVTDDELRISEIAVSSATVKIMNNDSDDADLKSLGISEGTLSPAFNSATIEYTVTVPYTTDKFSLVPITNHNKATLSEKHTNVALNVGENSIPVTVTAQDRVTKKTYTVKVIRTAPSTDATLKSLGISSGALSPGFTSGTINYTVTVPYTTTKFSLLPEKNHDKATISGSYTNVALNVGENTITVTVTAQDTTVTKKYTVKVIREECTDNTLKGLTTDKGTLSPVFSSSVVNYTINVPYDVDKITLTPVVNHDTAKIEESFKDRALSIGNNIIKINVKAQNGNVKTYTVTVVRAEPSDDATLKELGISAGTLSPAFNSAVLEYTVTVPYNVTSITLMPVTNHSFATLSGDYKNIALTEGVAKEIPIKVTAQAGGEPKEYKVTVTRQKCTDNTLKGLTTDKGQLSPAFSSSVVNYTINVPYEIDKITLTPIANHATATPSGDYTNKVLEVGNNTIVITVTAQDGIPKDYTVIVVRAKASTDATLKELGVSTGALSPIFDPAVENYIVNVPYKVSTISLSAVVNHAKATMSDAHTNIALEPGEAKDIIITVTAESGATKTYTVTVTRGLPSTDATLKELGVSSGKLSPSFNAGMFEYTVNVPFTTKTFTLTPVQNFAEAKLSGTYKNVVLKEGENKLSVVVTAEDGTTKQEYVVKVIRAASEKINDLTSLEIEGVELDKEFSSDVTEYNVTVPYTTESIIVKFAKAGNFSTVNVNSPYTVALIAGEVNDVIIEVSSQAGQIKRYIIHVTRTAAATDSTLEYVTPSESILNESFDPENTEYSMTVSTRIESMDFDFKSANEFAVAELDGENNLVLGENIFKITVTAQDGSQTVYTIVVTQVELPDDAKLSSLKVNGEDITLSDEVREYIFAVPIGTKEAIIEYITSDELAFAVLEGDATLKENGVDNIFKITVTAQDGTESVYTLQIYFRELETDSTLADLWDDRHSFEFDPEKTEFEFEVPYYVESVIFDYICAGNYAKVEINGPEKLLADTENEFAIIVTAEDGSSTTYKVVVTRRMMLDSTKLDSLVPSFGVLDFVSEVTEYKLNVPYSVSTITFTYTVRNENAVVTVTGVDELTVGAINVFEFKVEDENGDYTLYTVEVTRNNISTNGKLSSVLLNSNVIDGFDPNIFEYVVEIPNSVSSVILEYVCEHVMANASVTSRPEELIVGENVYVITVIAEDGITATEYTVKVIRADVDSDSTLSDLTTNVGDIEFDPAKTDYEINVENDVTSARINYTVSSKYAKAVFEGSEKLSIGANVYKITVTADDGSVTIYKVTINRRALSSDSDAQSITVGNVSLDVNSHSNKFNVTIPYGIDSVEVTAIPRDNRATVEINGGTSLMVGDNKITVKIIAEDGSFTIYDITVTRSQGSANALLSMLVPSVGELSPAFDSNILEYGIVVENSVNSIEFEIETASKFAKYVISNTKLEIGVNIIEITVTAQNGSTCTYVINVEREKLSIWNILVDTVLFTVGGVEVTALVFVAVALVIVIACVIVLIYVLNKDKVKRIRHNK